RTAGADGEGPAPDRARREARPGTGRRTARRLRTPARWHRRGFRRRLRARARDCPREKAILNAMPRAAWCLLLCVAVAVPAAAQQKDPLPVFAADLRGVFARHKAEPSVAT